MNAGQEITLSLFIQIIQAAGTVGVLTWLVWQFNRGSLIPKETADRLVEVYRQEAEKTFREILERLDKIVIVCPLGFSDEEIRQAVEGVLRKEKEKARGR